MDRLIDTPVNLSEVDGFLVLYVPMPGTEPENIRVRLGDDDNVTVESTPRGKREEPAKLYTHEWRVGDYNRKIKLPYPVDSIKTNATYRNGVLTVSMPRGSKTIEREIRLNTVGLAYGEEIGHRGREAAQVR